jgi:fructosamine-3-kinase
VTLPGPLALAVERATGRAPSAARRVAGGDLNEAWRVELDGGAGFVKTRPGATREEYEAEANGLRWLGEPGALAVPEVLGVAEDPPALVLAWVDEGPRGDEAALGRGLAAIHAAGAPGFGAAEPGAEGDVLHIGPLALPDEPAAGWPAFYAERRLRPLLPLAVDRGALTAAGLAAVERVCERVPDLAGPPEPPARLHGDLWAGNVLWARDGRPWLIDPAAHGGHREVDLAMLRLFGSPGPAFLAAYEELRPLAPGHAERVALWQLFPLLVHAVLFGGAYGAAAERAARRYA